jgi:hypothetical protein
VPGPRSRNDNSIKAEAAPIAVNRKDQLDDRREHVKTRDRREGINRDRQAGEHEHSTHRDGPRRTGHEGRLLQEIEDVGDRIVFHWDARLLRL